MPYPWDCLVAAPARVQGCALLHAVDLIMLSLPAQGGGCDAKFRPSLRLLTAGASYSRAPVPATGPGPWTLDST